MKRKPKPGPAPGAKKTALRPLVRPGSGGCVPEGGVAGRGSVPQGGSPDPGCFPVRRGGTKRR